MTWVDEKLWRRATVIEGVVVARDGVPAAAFPQSKPEVSVTASIQGYGPGSVLRARFAPARTDDLRLDQNGDPPLAVGETHEWTYMWTIDEPESPFVGQIAWGRRLGSNPHALPWVPTEDLADVVIVQVPFE